ncbi:protein kinase [Colletotrichum kahawae]|uniref:Protein kinase n=1 Tax=Colletotrichum kahawae TaxID=34407 RepID=A0AAD9YQP1_COLKA|nr:protein kinase [Colletotrichum kahawae]
MSGDSPDQLVGGVDVNPPQVSVPDLMSYVQHSESRDRAASRDPSRSAIRGQQDFLGNPRRTGVRANGLTRVSFPSTPLAQSSENEAVSEVSVQNGHSNGHPPRSIGTDSVCDDYGISQYHMNRESFRLSNDESDHVPAVDTLRGISNAILVTPDIAARERNILQESLIKALVRQKDGREFLPLAKLDELVTRKVVERQLRAEFEGLSRDADLQACIEYVCNREDIGGARHLKFTSGRRLFAILVMIEKLDSFADLRDADLRDIDLPLKRVDDDLRSAHRNKTFACFRSWSTFKLRAFEEWQWKLLAPYFSTADDAREKVLFYRLAPQTVMPWTEEETASAEYYGGQSWVKKVKIHESHHNFKSLEGRESYFAVKKLHSRDEKHFQKEVDALKRFSSRSNSNLVRLLATYQHQDDYCLLFPWADGNLRDLWEHVESPMVNPSQEGSVWMAEVCHGIAFGLAQIHNHRTTEELSRAAIAQSIHKANGVTSKVDPLSPLSNKTTLSGGDDSNKQRYGRHGDLKPENILWFKEPDGISRHIGILKISDFGLTRFHSQRSVSERASQRTVGFSNTYRAPEIDLKTGVNQHYDIWTLGCLYLEFITWFMGGWEDVDGVSVLRLEEDRLINKDADWIPEDNFFRLTHGSTKACLKDCVRTWISNLHTHPNCTEYIHQFLDFVENDMLRIEKKERVDCSEVVNTLHGLLALCRKNESFCVTAAPRPIKYGRLFVDRATAFTRDLNGPWQARCPTIMTGFLGLCFVGLVITRCDWKTDF